MEAPSGEVTLSFQLSAEAYHRLQEVALSRGGQTPEAWARKHIEHSTESTLRIQQRNAEDRAIVARYDPNENPIGRHFVEKIARAREACAKLDQALATLVVPGDRGGFMPGEDAHEVYLSAIDAQGAIMSMSGTLRKTLFDRDW